MKTLKLLSTIFYSQKTQVINNLIVNYKIYKSV